jgi:hypothetical protein
LGVPSATIETTPVPAAPNGEGPRRDRGWRHGAESSIVRPTGDLTRHIAATGALDGGRHALIMAKDQLPGRFTICQHNGSAGLALDCVKESVEHALLTHEIVLLDAPPLLTSADAVLLMQMPVGAILVVRGGRDQVREITSAMREIERLAPPVVGTVLNTFFADGEGDKLLSEDAGWQAA